jgi:hypothetical protein
LAEQSIKTFYETQQLTDPVGDPDDAFGHAVSISGNLAIVGDYGDTNSGASEGSAYIYAFDGSSWNQQAKLTASGSVSFGKAVAISGNMALVGDPFDDTLGPYTGAVYVFFFDGTTWMQTAKLFASDAEQVTYFGFSIALSGETAVIGAPFGEPGAIYVFTFDGTTWSEQVKLTSADITNIDDFGNAVSFSENRILVGAYGKDNYTGAAYVFSFDGSTWKQEAKLTASDGLVHDDFGWVVSISGDLALVGAPHKNQAYVFAFDGITWSLQATLKDPGAQSNDSFGSSVAISNKVALVGANHLVHPGIVYKFSLRQNTWTLRAQLRASDGMHADDFGVSMAFSGKTVLVGADYIGNPDSDGEAYIFSLGH